MLLIVKTAARISKQCVAAFSTGHAIMYSNTQQTLHRSLSNVEHNITLGDLR